MKVKHCNLPYDPKIQEGDGGLRVGVCVCRGVASTKGERLERKCVYVINI